MNKSIISIATLVAIILTSQVAMAETTVTAIAEDEGAQTHDGFFLRLSIGLGGSPEGQVAQNDDFDVQMPSPISDVAIGWTVADNLILHADFADVEVIGDTTRIPGDKKLESLHLDAAGIGLTYYIMPANIYVSGAVSVVNGYLTRESDFHAKEHAAGFGTNAMVGKEWWVSDNWGLGVAGMFNYTRIELDGDTSPRDITSLGVLFSATYN